MNPKLETELKIMTDQQFKKAAECLKTISHPARLKMVQILMHGEFAVHSVASLCRLSANQTCEHLRLMQTRGLLTSRRDGRTVYYSIASAKLPQLINCISAQCTEAETGN